MNSRTYYEKMIRTQASCPFELLRGIEYINEGKISYSPYIPYPINMESNQKLHEHIVDYLNDETDLLIDINSNCGEIGILAKDLYKKYYLFNQSYYSCQNAVFNFENNQIASKKSFLYISFSQHGLK
jgi:hypothetical protein